MTSQSEPVELVEYGEDAVETYWGWLQDEEIREATKTDGPPPSLDEVRGTRARWAGERGTRVWLLRERATGVLAGDVNVFSRENGEAELGVMVAERSCRRKGLAAAGLRLAMSRAREELGVVRFVAQVASGNEASLALFERRLGFRREAEVPEFGEVLLALGEAAKDEEQDEGRPDDWLDKWLDRCGGGMPSSHAAAAALLARSLSWTVSSQGERRARLEALVSKAAASSSKAEGALRRRLAALDADFAQESADLEARMRADPRLAPLLVQVNEP